MRNYLMGCTRQTQIGLLPDIINHNNDAVKSEFEYIFDSSLNRLTKSLYAPTGSVKAHFGEFVNLAVEYISIKNVDSLSETLLKAAAKLPHNTFASRYETELDESIYKNTSYCHNASIIAYDTTYNVYLKILLNTNSITDIQDYIDNDLSTRLNDISSYIINTSSNVNTLSNKVNNLQQYIYNQLAPDFDDVSAIAWKANNDTKDLSVYVHSIESKIDDISSAAWSANKDTKDLSIYVHSIESLIDDISVKAQTAYEYAYDVSVLVHNSSFQTIADVSAVAHEALDTANKNTDFIIDINASINNINLNIDNINISINDISKYAKNVSDRLFNLNNQCDITNVSVNTLEKCCVNVNTSLNDLTHNNDITNVSVNTLEKCCINVNTSLNTLNSSVADISINLDKLIAEVSDLSTNMVNLKNANFQITYNSSIYNVSDIVQLLDWKNSLTVETIQATLPSGMVKTLNVLCVGSTSDVTNINTALNQLTGLTSAISNPEDYTEQDVDNASTLFNNLI